jgi:hypothetical protein
MASDAASYGSEFWLNFAMEAVIEENTRKAPRERGGGRNSVGTPALMTKRAMKTKVKMIAIQRSLGASSQAESVRGQLTPLD